MDPKTQELELDKMAAQSDSDSTISSGSRPDPLDDTRDIEMIATSNTQHSKDGPPAQRLVTAQDWTGPEDLENPHNWPLWKKCYHTALVGVFCFTV